MNCKNDILMRMIQKVSLHILIFILFALAMLALPAKADATCPNGIYGNGLGGINININAAPYTDPRWAEYGDPYGPGGCTWFVGARVMELTGKGGYATQDPANWYYWYGESIGFSKGTAWPTGKAVIVKNGHVSILEKTEGDTVYISEGGFTGYGTDASYGHSIIRTVSKSEVYNGLIGFVYLGNLQIAATTNKGAEASFVTNETVQLSVSPDAYSYYVLKIYYTPVGGKTSLYWEGQVSAAKAMSFSKPGYYSCTFLGDNSVESKWVGWRVVEATAPTVTVSTQDKTATVNWTDVKANSYYFYVLDLDDNTTHFGANNGKWFNTQVKLDDGRYRAYVTAVYSSTIMKSGSCDFTINTAAQNIYSIHYNANGGSGKMADTQVSYGASFQPRANTFTRNCYNFVGWATSPDTKTVTYKAGTTYTYNRNGGLTLYAVWKEGTHKWDAGKVTKKATTTSTGVKTYTCTLCGKTKTETIPKLAVKPSYVRIYGADRYATSLKIADAYKKALGVSKFSAVCVADGQNFPDALAGAYFAAQNKAPIIDIRSNAPTGQQTMNALSYIKKNLKAGGKVYILGGPDSVPDSVASNLMNAGFQVTRLWGQNRYTSNLEILKAAKVKAGTEFIVTTGATFADALTASATGKPVLLVTGNALTKEQKAYLSKAGIKKFTIVGTTKEVSAGIANQLKAYASVSRISGTNAYERSIAVAKKYFPGTRNHVNIADGRNFPDALCAGPLAIKKGGPLFLTDGSTTVNAKIRAYTKAANTTKATVYGGPASVSDATAKKILGID